MSTNQKKKTHTKFKLKYENWGEDDFGESG